MKHLLKKILVLLFAIVLISSCKDQWEDHNALNHAVLAVTLDQLVSSKASLSKFNDYLKKTGYDKILASSKIYTVWAPSNDALGSLDQSIVDDTAKLKQFIRNHIAYQEYPTNQGQDIKIKMINGKNLLYTNANQELDGISIDTVNRNIYCKNGLLHIVNAPIYPKSSIWEYFQGITDVNVSSQQTVLSLTVKTFDAINSVRVGSNSSGEPVYDTVWVYKNVFLNSVRDVSNEDSTFTFFVLNNNAYSNEFAKMRPYLTDTTSNIAANLTDYYTSHDVLKDIVVRGKYTSDNLPDSVYSTNGIKIYKKNLVIDNTYEGSNGNVFMVSKFDIPLTSKIPTVVVEGENYVTTYDSAFKYVSVPLLGIRARFWASGGKDMNVWGDGNGHKVPYLSVAYNTPKLYTLSYNIYWRAVNDFQASTYVQKIAINPKNGKQMRDTTFVLFKYKIVQLNDYSDVLLGTTLNTQYASLNLYLVANNIIGSTWNNPLVLDYFKLVPVFN